MKDKFRRDRDTFINTPVKSVLHIKCRGCKKIHTLIDKAPIDFTCDKCGRILAKDAKIFPIEEELKNDTNQN